MKKIITCIYVLLSIHSNIIGQGTFTKLDIATGSSSANPRNFIEYNNKLFFTAFGSSLNGIGEELYATDGTQIGTQLIGNLNPNFGANSSPKSFVVFNNELYFSAYTNSNGRELYKTNGTVITLLKDIAEGMDDAIESTSIFIELNGFLYFFAQDTASSGYDLWRTNGTSAGTIKMLNLNYTSVAGNKLFFKKYNNELYFLAQEINDNTVGIELYKYNPNTNSVNLVIDVFPSNGQTSTIGYSYFTLFDNKLFFVADGKLRYTNGTSTSIITNGTNNITAFFKPKVLNNQLIFIGNSTNNGSQDIYKCYYDIALGNYNIGLVYNFSQTVNLPFASVISNDGLEQFTELNGKLYFAAREATSPNSGTVFQIYETDGVSTNVVIPITYSGAPSSRPISFITAFQDKLYYQSYANNSPEQLWEANPSTGTFTQLSNYTAQVNVPEQIFNGPMIVFNNELYFEAQKSGEGYELWKLNNTPLPSICHSFIGKNENQKNLLYWTVSNQINTLQFIVEKSNDGVHFKNIYTISATANREDMVTYSFIDNHINEEINYYRIKQVDVDGKWMFLCNTIKITQKNMLNEFSFYPNSANSHIYLQLTSDLINSTVNIFNVHGQLVFKQKTSSLNQKLNISHLNNGTYYIQVMKGNIIQNKKLIIQH